MTTPQSSQLGELVRAFRHSAAISQEELAERSTVSVRTISDLERGIRATARLETVRLLADGLGLEDQERTALIEAAIRERGTAGPPMPAFRLASLPRTPNALIGRESLVCAIVDLLLRGNRIVTLTGTGGVGKTRVAIEVASRWSEQAGAPVAFIDLTLVTDAARMPSAIAQALDLPGAADSPEERLLAFVRRQHRLLMVLDNFEHLMDASGFVARMANASSGATFLVTSRARLRLSAERHVVVPALDLPVAGMSPELSNASGALQLFIERAREIDADLRFDDEVVDTAAEICRRVDGLPLAIELATSKLRVIPPDKLLSLLETRLSMLTGAHRDQPARHQSMRDTIAWSYDLLRGDHQRLYRWLAVYVGGFSLEAVEHAGLAIGLNAVDAIEALEELVESGLVQRLHGPGKAARFRMLETIREYGLEQLEAAGELDAARLSHARQIASFAAEGAPLPARTIPPDWYHRLQTESANLVAAFDYACGSGPLDLCLEYMSIAGAYWDYWGPYELGATRLLKALERVPMEPSLETAHALHWTAFVTMYAGEYDRAKELGETALGMARSLNDRRSEAAALHILGWNAEVSEQWSESRDFFQQALEHWIEIGEVGTQGQIYMLLGGHTYMQGDYAEARRLEEEAQRILADAGNDWAAGPEWYLGFIDRAEGKLGDAARHFQRTLELWVDSDSRTHQFKPIIHLADVAAELGAYETAAKLAGICDALLEYSDSKLFPFDVPAWERATSRSRAALGDERFEALHRAGRLFGQDDWLRLAAEVVDRAG